MGSYKSRAEEEVLMKNEEKEEEENWIEEGIQPEKTMKKKQKAQNILQKHNEDHLPGYRHQKARKSTYARKFRDKQRLKEAFIASEIFNRKFF